MFQLMLECRFEEEFHWDFDSVLESESLSGLDFECLWVFPSIEACVSELESLLESLSGSELEFETSCLWALKWAFLEAFEWASEREFGSEWVFECGRECEKKSVFSSRKWLTLESLLGLQFLWSFEKETSLDLRKSMEKELKQVSVSLRWTQRELEFPLDHPLVVKFPFLMAFEFVRVFVLMLAFWSLFSMMNSKVFQSLTVLLCLKASLMQRFQVSEALFLSLFPFPSVSLSALPMGFEFPSQRVFQSPFATQRTIPSARQKRKRSECCLESSFERV